ncbi:efflux RND transporter periplasmic adaptor subunit [Pseudomonas sp. NPDC007930]|uniref:efflux RND transporter periplasmic adaptor subunit n=1 Tax=Pseudomonas sp. NPDC007930 TaxID=3364417 RepID=UPI0036E50B9A
MPTNTLSRRSLLWLAGGLSLAAVLVASGLHARAAQAQAVAAWGVRQATPTVSVIQPSQGQGSEPLQLPARLEAWARAPIHARVSGYLKSWNTDIGSTVSAGQVLATIDSPDLDQQLAQAHARWLQSQATARQARLTAQRWAHLLDTHAVARQDADQKAADASAAEATEQAARADWQRLRDLANYKTLRAPFAGTVTARNTDVGQLIQAGNDQGPALFEVADTHSLRLYVPVPQAAAGALHPGVHATLRVPEHPGRSFDAVLLGDSAQVDAKSGTLLAQFAAGNPDGALLPGDYAEATLNVPPTGAGLSIPASALIFRGAGTQVALLDGHQRVHLQPVHIGQDRGATLYIDQGLKPGDQVIDNPPDALGEHDRVVPAKEEGSHA